MSWGWLLGAIALAVAAAAGVEAWLKRGTRRPLARHAPNPYRWDDPNRPERNQDDHLLVADHAMGRFGLTGKREWRFPKDPQAQARALMPERARTEGKEDE